jgi:hypothetical protein
MGSTHERMRDGALRMRLIPVVIGLLGLPALAGGLVTANDALTAMDFPADRIEENHATPEIILEDDAIAPGGTTWIGVRFKIENGWHLYWNGRNDSGSPPSFAGELPAGYTLGEWLWPAPKRHIAPGDILDHIYEDSVLLDGAAQGPRPLSTAVQRTAPRSPSRSPPTGSCATATCALPSRATWKRRCR